MRTPLDLLWELHGSDDGPAPSDSELRAYRAGSLTAADTVRLEWMLARSAVGRTRLAALAGVFPRAVPRRLRRRLFPDARAPRRWTLDWLWIAAAAVVMVVAAALVFLPHPPEGIGRLPEFEVRVLGIAETRSAPGTARARPESAVTIWIEAQGPTIEGLDYAVYRLGDGGLERLPSDRVTLEMHRGGAVLRTTGEGLAGNEPGEHAFFVAVAPAGQLPERLGVEIGQDPAEALRRESSGRVMRQTLTIERVEDDP